MDCVNDDSDDELITNMEPVDVFVNSNEPTFVYTNREPVVLYSGQSSIQNKKF